MGHSICAECGDTYTFDMKPRRQTCFRCHLGTVNLGFVNGKEDFHGPTIRERQRSHEAEMTKAGIAWEKLPEKAVF